jgi:pimeloyl-ACP methyl ester carboxylesterase
MGLYEYNKKPLVSGAYSISLPKNSQGILVYDLSFPSPCATGIEENDTVHARIFQKDESPGVKPEASEEMLILVHGFAARHLENYNVFASSMAEKGMATIFINLPLHLERTPAGESSGESLIGFDDIQTLDFFHQAVADIRRLLDIGLAILKPERIYLCGISMGCMVSTLAAAFDERIDRASLLMGGGNWEEIHWKGVLRYILKGDCSRNSTGKKRTECRKAYREFPAFLAEFKKTGKNGLTAGLEGLDRLKDVTPKACFLCDPMAFAHMIDPRRILMINSRLDMYFSRRSSQYLWKELGRPQIIWVNNFHSSKILKNRKLQEIISGFFRK